MLGGPCCRHRGPQVNDDEPHVENIKQQGNNFEPKGSTGITRSGNRTKENGTHAKEGQGGDEYVQGQHGILDQRRVVGVYMNHGTGKSGDNDHNRSHNPQADERKPSDKAGDLLDFACSDGVAHHGAGGGADGMGRNGEDCVEAAHNVGDCQRTFTHIVFNEQEEKHPGANRKKILHHHEEGDIEYSFDDLPLKTNLCETILLRVNPLPGIKEEEKSGGELRDNRGYGSTSHAHLRHTQVPEYQSIVEYHIYQRHHHSIDCKYFRTRDTDVKCPEHHIDKCEDKTKHTPLEILRDRPRHICRLEHGGQPGYRAVTQERNEQQGRDKQEDRALYHDIAYLAIVSLPVTPSYQYLATHTKAKTQRIQGDVDNSGQGRRTQLHFSYTSKKSGIDHLYHVLRQQTQQDRRTYFYNVPARIHIIVQ